MIAPTMLMLLLLLLLMMNDIVKLFTCNNKNKLSDRTASTCEKRLTITKRTTTIGR